MASAATRFHSGSVRTTLASHIATNASNAASGPVLTGPNVMASVVGAMALLALGFLVVTLIRRRTTIA